MLAHWMDEKNHKAPRRHPYYRMIIVCIAHSLKTITFTGVDHFIPAGRLKSSIQWTKIDCYKKRTVRNAKLRCIILSYTLKHHSFLAFFNKSLQWLFLNLRLTQYLFEIHVNIRFFSQKVTFAPVCHIRIVLIKRVRTWDKKLEKGPLFLVLHEFHDKINFFRRFICVKTHFVSYKSSSEKYL